MAHKTSKKDAAEREGEAPAEPCLLALVRLGRSLALPGSASGGFGGSG